MKTINGTQFYNVYEIGETLGVHPQTVRKLIAAGKIRAVRIGYMDFITTEALNEYLGITSTKTVQA